MAIETKSASAFGEFLETSDIVIGLHATDIASASRRLLEQTLPLHGFPAQDIERLIEAVEAREHEISTVCGPIAIPHARDPQVHTFIGAAGVNRNGIVETQRAPRVIFVFISPESQRSKHLELLAALARLSRNEAAIDAIAEARTANDVIALLK